MWWASESLSVGSVKVLVLTLWLVMENIFLEVAHRIGVEGVSLFFVTGKGTDLHKQLVVSLSPDGIATKTTFHPYGSTLFPRWNVI